MARVHRTVAITVLLLLVGCAHQPVTVTSLQAISKLNEQANQIQTVRGRAWFSVKSAEGDGSFQTTIVIDRRSQHVARVRIEATDPFGATHSVIILDEDATTKSAVMTWINFDTREITKIKDSWHGLSLKRMADVMLGLARIPANNSASSIENDSFHASVDGQNMLYNLTMLSSGSRLALSGIEGESAAREHYEVKYFRFLDRDDFYLPERVRVEGKDLQISITWRDRRWNGSILEDAFAVPHL